MHRSLKKTAAAGLAAAALVLGTTTLTNATDANINANANASLGAAYVGYVLGNDGLTLSTVNVERNTTPKKVGTVSGLLPADTKLVGIDFRIQDGKLYGVGNGSNVYTIDLKTGAATFVNALTFPLAGTAFGVDFNPAADRLRIISNTGQNLRHNVNAGGVTLNDGGLNNGATPTPAPVNGIESAAYTNNDLNAATGTVLFDASAVTDNLLLQAPPNAGGVSAIGALGLDFTAITSFDIGTQVKKDGTVINRSYLVGTTTAADGSVKNGLYSVDLLSGRATFKRLLPVGVASIAVPHR